MKRLAENKLRNKGLQAAESNPSIERALSPGALTSTPTVQLPRVATLLPARHTSSIAHPHVRRRRLRAKLGFNFANPLMETALNLRHSFDLTEMTGLIEMLEIGAQLQQEFLGKTMTHRKSILHINRGKCKITRFSFPRTRVYPSYRTTTSVLALPTPPSLG